MLAHILDHWQAGLVDVRVEFDLDYTYEIE